MYNDDIGLSPADGFMEVNGCVTEMIKYVANEPSVGLYYVQQHTHNAIPNLLHLKERVAGRSHETTLHTEDLEDSVTMVRSMKDCGSSIADEMIKDIRKSLVVMSASQPKRGLIGDWGSSFQIGKRSSSWGSMAFSQNTGFSQQEGENSDSYISTVINSAKQRAASIRWPQLDTKQPSGVIVPSSDPPSEYEAVIETVSVLPGTEAEELPVSSQTVGEQLDEAMPFNGAATNHNVSSEAQNYEEFKADRVAKLEEWLEERENSKGNARNNSKDLKLEGT